MQKNQNFSRKKSNNTLYKIFSSLSDYLIAMVELLNHSLYARSSPQDNEASQTGIGKASSIKIMEING